MNPTSHRIVWGVPRGNTFALTLKDEGKLAVSNVADIEEYTYEDGAQHLSASEAVERYRKALESRIGDTLVVLDQHDCGHWSVEEFKTDAERQAYFKDRLRKTFWQFFNVFSK